MTDPIASVCSLLEKEIDDINTFTVNKNTLIVENVKIELKDETNGKLEDSPSLILSWNLEVCFLFEYSTK